MTKQEINDLVKPRYKVIADYPDSPYTVGEILEGGSVVDFVTKYPGFFKKLKWYEEIDLTILMTVKYIKVIEYVGYYREGDVVPVSEYGMDLRANHVAFLGFYLGNNKDNFHKVSCVFPQTEEDYETFKTKK